MMWCYRGAIALLKALGFESGLKCLGHDGGFVTVSCGFTNENPRRVDVFDSKAYSFALESVCQEWVGAVEVKQQMVIFISV